MRSETEMLLQVWADVLRDVQNDKDFMQQTERAAHRGGGGKRVDRAQPSGNDFLADATERPRRHKRKEY